MTTSPKNALTVLNRLAARRSEQTSLLERALTDRLDTLALTAVEVAVESGDPIGTVLARLLNYRNYDALFEDIEKVVPKETIALRELGLVIIRKRFEAKVYQHELNSVPELLQASVILNEYSNALCAVGKLTEARNASAFALQVMELVPTQGNPELTAGLAALWHSLSYVEAELGEFENAEPLAQKAVELYGQALQLGSRSVGMLADAESNLATILLVQKKFEQARTLLEDGIRRVEQIGQASSIPDRFYFARLNNNLAIVFRELGNFPEARAVAEIAAVTIRQLSEAMPDAYRGYLARYLMTRGSISLRLGENEEAKDDLNEAVTLLKELNLQRPDAFANDYLLATATLATLNEDKELPTNIEWAINRATAEPARWRQWWTYAVRKRISGLGENWGKIAAELRRTLAKIQEIEPPSEDPPSEKEILDEAQLMFVQAFALRRTGDNLRSLQLITDTIRRIEPLHGEQAMAWRARAKFLRGGFLCDDGQMDDGMTEYLEALSTFVDLEDFDEAARILRVATDTVRAKRDVALSLRFLERMETSFQKVSLSFTLVVSVERLLILASAANADNTVESAIHEAASSAVQSVSSAANDLTVTTDSRKDLHLRLKEVANLLLERGLLPEAVESILRAAKEALGSKSHLDPDLRELLFQSMMDDARYFMATSRSQKAFQIFEEAVARQRESLRDRPYEPPLGLASCLDQWSQALHKVGRSEQALRIAQEAADSYERAFQLQPASMWLEYAGGLNNLANRYWNVGLKDQSVLTLERGLALFEAHSNQRGERAMLIRGSLLGSYLERAANVGRSTTDFLSRYTRRLNEPQNQ